MRLNIFHLKTVDMIYANLMATTVCMAPVFPYIYITKKLISF